jgi:hypothetical protein
MIIGMDDEVVKKMLQEIKDVAFEAASEPRSTGTDVFWAVGTHVDRKLEELKS